MPFQSPAFQFPDALTKYNRWIETGVLNWWCPLRYIRDRYRRGLFSPRRSVTNAPKKVAGPTPPKVQFLVHREYSGNVKQTFYFPFSDFKKLFFYPIFFKYGNGNVLFDWLYRITELLAQVVRYYCSLFLSYNNMLV